MAGIEPTVVAFNSSVLVSHRVFALARERVYERRCRLRNYLSFSRVSLAALPIAPPDQIRELALRLQLLGYEGPIHQYEPFVKGLNLFLNKWVLIYNKNFVMFFGRLYFGAKPFDHNRFFFHLVKRANRTPFQTFWVETPFGPWLIFLGYFLGKTIFD